eukprot:72730_1
MAHKNNMSSEIEDKLIPPNYSIRPPDLMNHKRHGINIFKERIKKNRQNEILQQSHWNIIIDYILQNVLTQNAPSKSIQLLHNLQKRASECLIPRPENRVISMTHNDFVNPGCKDLFTELGFFAMDNELIITEPDKDIIKTATTTISKRIEIIKLTQQLHVLWKRCMTAMQQHTDHKSQPILHRISRYDLSTDYEQYFDVLTALIDISPHYLAGARDDFAIEILSHLGFEVRLVYSQDKTNTMIFDLLIHMYDIFRKIESIKQSVYRNEAQVHFADPAIEFEDAKADVNANPAIAIAEEHVYDHKQVQQPIQYTGVESFEAILTIESREIMCEQLLNPINWDHLINSMCDGLHKRGKKDIAKTLKNFKKTAQKAGGTDPKYRNIDTTNAVTQKKLLGIPGGMAFLKGIGFEKEKTLLRLLKPNQQVLKVAISCLDERMAHLDSLRSLQKAWNGMIASMYRDPTLSSQVSALNVLISMDLSNDEVDGYQEMLIHIEDIASSIDSERKIPQLLLERVGVTLDPRKQSAHTANVIKSVLYIYKQIKSIEKRKEERRQMHEMAAGSRHDDVMKWMLNELWGNCVALMMKHDKFNAQLFIMKKMQVKDFSQKTDYNWLLVKVIEAGQMQVYRKDILAARQIVRSLNFKLPQHFDEDEIPVLKSLVKVYEKVEEIHNFTRKNKNNNEKLIRTSADDKHHEQFRNNPDNVIGDFSRTRSQTPSGISGAEFLAQSENDEKMYHESLLFDDVVPRGRARALTVVNTICQQRILDCPHTQRILRSLGVFQKLNMEFVDHQQQLVRYFYKEHTELLDDHIHVTRYHDAEVQKVSDRFKCRNDLQCKSLQRYHGESQDDYASSRGGRTRSASRVERGDPEFIFYRDTMDSIHCYMYHLFDLGLRITQDDERKLNHDFEEYDEDMIDFDDDEKYDVLPDLPAISHPPIDTHLSRLSFQSKRLSQRLSKQPSLQPASIAKQKSMNIKHGKYKLVHNKDADDKSCMFIDGMSESLSMQRVRQHEITKMVHQLYKEEYDSDALLDDIDDGKDRKNSNIAWMLNEYYDNIIKYVNFTKLSDRSFSIGFRFYYWEYYRKKDEEEIEYFQNKNFHSGYKPHELYITAKWKDIKEEVLCNSIFSIEMHTFQKEYNKTLRYFRSDTIKEIRADSNRFLHYDDIWDEQNLLEEHLLSVTLYCDLSELCTEFSATFRKKHVYEPIRFVKERNREFARWSKRLRETVELYGKKGWERRDKDEEQWNCENNRIKGPFYCGIDNLMPMPEFSIRLCAPTSTSSSKAVAHNFAGDEGCIITLNNNGHWHSNNLRIWDCSWLSNFKGESENLLMGGFYTIRVQGITHMKTSHCYAVYFKSLFYLDCMLTGISMLRQKPRIKKTDKHLLSELIFRNGKSAPPYVNDTFKAYQYHRKHIVINLHQIHTYFDKLKDLLIETSGRTWECDTCFSKGNSIHCSRCWMCTATSSNNVRGVNNLLKAQALEQFPNLEHIVLYTTSGTGQNEYVFDSTKLLNNVINYVSCPTRSQKIITIEIKGTHRYELKTSHRNSKHEMTHQRLSWLSAEWTDYGPTLESFLKSFNPLSTITLQHTENRGARVYMEDTLFIKIVP